MKKIKNESNMKMKELGLAMTARKENIGPAKE